MTRPTVLFAHAYLPPNVRARYEAACPGWRLVPFVSPFPGMSAAYDALIADLRRRYPGAPLLSALLRHLKIDDAGPLVFAWFSGGYSLARALVDDPVSFAAVSAWVGIDGMHTGKDADKTASDAGVQWLVRLAQAGLVGETVVAIGHSDVQTYGSVASTTDVAAEVRRLASVPAGAGPHGSLVLRGYNVRANDHDEHVAALREWGASLLGESLALLPRPVGGTSTATTATTPGAPPTSTAIPSQATRLATTETLLRLGDAGAAVQQVQELLVAAGATLDTDGFFGPLTEAAVRSFQGAHGLKVDGIVGPATRAALRFPAVAPAVYPADVACELGLPAPLTESEVDRVFGAIPWSPVPGDESAIVVPASWREEHLVLLRVPELVGIPGASASGHVQIARAITDQFCALWATWRAKGKLPLVRSWAGSVAFRRVRGGVLVSRHARGLAFDINVDWNPRGGPGAPRGAAGSVCDLLEDLPAHGFTTGGLYPLLSAPPDWMHIEAREVRP